MEQTTFVPDATEPTMPKKTRPLVVALYESDLDALTKLVEVRNAARPDGARKVSRSAVVRSLIREASR